VIDPVLESKALSALRKAIEEYEKIQEATWESLQEICTCISLKKKMNTYTAQELHQLHLVMSIQACSEHSQLTKKATNIQKSFKNL